MKKLKTTRNFEYYEFKDRYDAGCSLQKSSLATEDCIWLGIDDADPKKLVPGKGWVSARSSENISYNTRMHLTRDQVKAMLPILKKFVRTGEI